MGGKKGGGARTPTIQANTLHSAQRLKVVDLISSGEIFGFKHGNDEPLKSILLNGTPIQNQDGSLNFSGVKLEFNRGVTDQDYLPSASSSDKSVEVRAQVKKNTPVTRTIENKAITSIRVTVGVDALMNTTKEGDQLATSVSMSVMIMKNDQIHSSKGMTLSEKGSKPFQQDLLFDDLPEAPFDIRCVRNTADSNSDMLRNDTYFFSYVESIDAKMRYPMSAIASLEMDSAQFGGSVPTRNYDLLAKIVQVPSNYDPIKRTYSGLWDRLFKPAHTNNPAWILYDLLTDKIDGFGYRDLKVDIDKLYEASKYCDELVDDGAGGKEPRFVCNSGFYGDDAHTAISNICSSFRAVFAFNGDVATVYYDRAHDVTAVYNNSNVVDGIFDYSMTKRTEQYNQVQVQFVDEENGYETTIIEVSDDEHIALHGLNTLSVVGFGVTKRSYAIRNGKWTLTTNLSETVPVSFNIGAQGIKHEVYDIIEIADNDFIGEMLGARVLGSSGNKIILDREIKGAIAFSIDTTSGRSEKFKVKRQLSAKEYELESIPNIIESAACNAMLASVEPRLFRCLDIAENGDGTYQIVAIQHNPRKEEIVDNSAEYLAPIVTTINPMPSLTNGFVNQEGRALVLGWDSLAVIGSTNTYRVQLFKDKVLYRSIETKETSVKLENLPQGEYVAKVRAINERGQFSEELVIAFSTSYKISGLRAKGVVFGIELNWEVPPLITNDAHTEIWFSDVDDRQKARKMAVVTYPQSHYSLSGLSIGDELYFWFRLVDADGNQGEFTHSIKGSPNDSADDVLGYLDGKISEKEISKDLQDQFDSNIDDKVEKAKEEINSAIDDIEIDLTGVNSEIDNIKTDITNIDSEIDSVKESTEKALSDAEKNAQAIKEQSTVIDEVKVSQDQSEANWQLAQMSNVSVHKSEFARSMSMSAQVAQNIAKIEEIDSFVVTEREATATRFTQINTRVDSAESKITSVETSLASDIKAEASKREALEVVFDLSKANQQLQLMTQATADKSLSSRLFSMSASTANAHAKYDELQEVVATNEDARVTSEQKLQAEIDSSKANITRLDEVMTSEFASQATSISNLSSELDGAKANIKQAEQAIVDNEKSQAKRNDEFNTQFGENEAKQQLSLLTESSNTRSLSHRYFSLSAQTANSSARIDALQQTFTDTSTAWAISEQHLQSQIESSKSEISRIDKTVTDNEKSQALAMSSLSSELDNAKAEIKEVEKTQVDSEKSQAAKNKSIDAQFDDNKASQQLANISHATSEKSISQRVSSLSAATANANASIDELSKTQADDNKALTEQINSAKSEIDGHSASITQISKTQATTDGKINAMYTLKVDAKGNIGGIMLGANEHESMFKVAADTFVVATPDQSVNMFSLQKVSGKTVAALNGDLIAKGSISGDKITANTSITSPIIKGGRVESGHFAGGSINIGNGNFSVDSKGNLIAKSGTFEGTVFAKKIKGGIVDLVQFRDIRIDRSDIDARRGARFYLTADDVDYIYTIKPFLIRVSNGDIGVAVVRDDGVLIGRGETSSGYWQVGEHLINEFSEVDIYVEKNSTRYVDINLWYSDRRGSYAHIVGVNFQRIMRTELPIIETPVKNNGL